MRPLFFADVRNLALRDEDRGFLLGPDLAVHAPLDEPGHVVNLGWVTLPSLAEGDDDPDEPRLELRPGAILPLRDAQEFTGERPFDHLTLLVALDKKGRAEGELYEDAGEGFGYRKGDYRRALYTAARRGKTLRVAFGRAEGRRPAPGRRVTVRAWNGTAWTTAEGIEGRTLEMPL